MEKIVVDSAFNLGKRDYSINLSQLDPMNCHVLLANRGDIFIRQLSEWVMLMIEGSSPRLNDLCMYQDKDECILILRLMTHLYNFQTAKVGINQLMNLFMNKTSFLEIIILILPIIT